jgi:hypothetical protein
MNEGTKTGLFWLVSLVVVAMAMFVAYPRGTDEQGNIDINQPLFAEFTDPLVAASLKIVTYDETLGELESFEVAKNRQTGLWSIPSRQGYPADATEQMQKAATAFLDLRILDIASVNAEDHDDFGVLEPIVDKLRVGDSGVGRLVAIKDQDGGELASLIIGNEVKDEEGKRYVRKPGQDPVYSVKLDDSPLTTKFADWIEDDLLQLNSFDIAGTEIHNYSVALGGGLQQLSVDMDNSYDASLSLNDQNEWQLDNFVVYDETNAGEVKSLKPDESLNTKALNDMKNALDDLKIVDVVRKPDGMSADLKAAKSLVENNQSLQSLLTRGFYPVGKAGSETGLDILSANGEMTVDLKDGVQYVLRFGGIAGISDDETSEGEDPERAAIDSEGSNRYLLVTARFNDAMIPTPDLNVVPQSYEELQAMLNPVPEQAPVRDNPLASEVDAADAGTEPEMTETEAGTPEAGTPEEPTAESGAPKGTETAEPPKPADPAVPAEAPQQPAEGGAVETPAEPVIPEVAPEVIEKSGEGATEFSGSGEGSGGGRDADPQQPPAEEPATETPPAEEAVAAEPMPQEPAAVQPPAETPADPAPAIESPANAQPAQDERTEEEKKEFLQAEQEKIVKENDRLLDEWKEKINQAKRRVAELNGRFADWYYIIPESTYRDLQLSLDTLVQPKSAAEPSQFGQPGGQFSPPGGFNFGN